MGTTATGASDARSRRDPCVLCGSDALPEHGDRACPICGWRLGESPDADLPRPRVEVVYYLRWEGRVKIGTSANPRQRLAAIWHQELLAFERGGRTLERSRHEQFAHLREGGEWFRAEPELMEHAARLAAGTPPWDSYARWMADALRRNVS